MQRFVSSFWLAALAVAVLSQTVAAAPALVTDRSLLGGNDFVDWSVLGPPVPVPPPWVDSPIQTPSASGELDVEVVTTQGLNPAARFRRVDEGTVLVTGWRGNFAIGDALLFSTAVSTGPFSIEFSEPVFGAGAQVQSSLLGAFRGRIRAFDSGGLEVLDQTVTGASNIQQNDSAIFLGVSASTPVIQRIEISVEHSFGFFGFASWPFAMNQLDINREERPVAQPIPVFGGAGAGFLVLLVLATGLFFARNGRRLDG